jgi:deoxyribonuclease V
VSFITGLNIEGAGKKYYITPEEAKAKQRSLQKCINIQPLKGEVKTVAGADISFRRGSHQLYAGVVVLRLPNLNITARSLAAKEVNFPYIPGLLSFRIIPALLEAWKQLAVKPDIVILTGHGLAHPRRMGLATQFGITVDHPAIGCAKNILTGEFKEVAAAKGSFQYIIDNNERIGMVYRSQTNVNPIFISPGNSVSFKDTRSIIEQCLMRFRLPETMRQARAAVKKLQKGEWKPGYWEKEIDAHSQNRLHPTP